MRVVLIERTLISADKHGLARDHLATAEGRGWNQTDMPRRKTLPGKAILRQPVEACLGGIESSVFNALQPADV